MFALGRGDGISLALERLGVQREEVVPQGRLLRGGALGGRFLEDRRSLGRQSRVGRLGLTLGLRLGGRGRGRGGRGEIFGRLLFPGGEFRAEPALGGLERLTGAGHRGGQLGEPSLVGRRDHEHAFLAAADVGFMDIGEERPEGVEVPLRERVELMVVALGAAGRLAQPGRADRAHAVRQHPLLVVLGLGPAFLGGQQQAVEAGAHLGLDVGVRQQVARHLLQGEAVEPLVLVEAPDDIVAVGPDVTRGVAVVADGVGVAHDIEPALGETFAVVRAGEQAFHQPGVGVGRAIGDEGIHLFRRGRQAEEVEVEAAGERAAVGLADGAETLRTQPGLDQRVDGRVHGRRGGLGRPVV